MREKHFNIALTFIVSAVISYLIFSGTSLNSVIGTFGAIGFNIVLLLTTGFGLQYFQLGTKVDIQEEIYDGNLAVAVYQAGIWIAIAIAISKGVM